MFSKDSIQPGSESKKFGVSLSSNSNAMQSGEQSTKFGSNSNEQRKPAATASSAAQNRGDQSQSMSSPSITLPSISLPKGGGAIRDIGGKFQVNAPTGTGSMTIPISISSSRGTVRPELNLSYSSGNGNGPFGLGWDLSPASISRKTDKGLPQYRDGGSDEESDVFIKGGDDLVPVFQRDSQGAVVLDARGIPIVYDESRNGFSIRTYRPRIEKEFLRIERWTQQDDPSQIHWRTTTNNNVTSIYGSDDNSRVYDPTSNAKHIFKWLVAEMYDVEGNAIMFVYKPEDSANIPPLANEQNRDPQVRSSNRYLKTIKYGNLMPNRDQTTWAVTSAFNLPATTWMFSVVLDYGEHDVNNPTSAEVTSWPYRQDPFSTFRSGFEIRTYRLCRRILMFHHFSELTRNDYLVKSTNLTYDENPYSSFLTQATQMGYIYDPTQNQYSSKSFPPLEFSYSRFPTDDELSQLPIQPIDSESLQNLPIGVDGATYQWVDLDGEGLSGVFVEQGQSWYYKRNLSARGPRNTIVPQFGASEPVNSKPSAPFSKGDLRFLSLAGDGHLNVVNTTQGLWGYYERTNDSGWASFRYLKTSPNVNTKNPELKFIDITGDGLTDILVSEDQVFTWYASLGYDGYAAGAGVPKALNEEAGARLIFADPEQTIYLADMSGDGLTDILRVRNGEICYWPNLGYGRFGAKIRMDNAPWFDRFDQFNQKRIRIADVDGSGTSDILYIGSDSVDIYLNQSGNGFSNRKSLGLPRMDNLSTVNAVDLMGTGTTCLVWSSPLPGNARRPMQYVDLTRGVKPNLLIQSINNLGAETRIHYAPSTTFYQADKLAGKPWVTRLPFPVHCVEKLEVFDLVSRHHFVSRFAYHDGYFDGFEREFRGFAMVEQWDTEDFDTIPKNSTATNLDSAWHVPPIYTKTWLHTGVYIDSTKISQYLAHGYFGAPPVTNSQGFSQFLTTLLDDSVLPQGLNSGSTREACRSLKGLVLRKEVYAADKSPKSTLPYTVAENNYTIEILQSQLDSHFHSTFTVHPREALSYQFERNLDDPRISHDLTLQVDAYGNVLKSVKIAYGRAAGQSTLSGIDQSTQQLSILTYNENDVSVAVIDTDNYLLPRLSESRTYQIYGFQNGASRFALDDFAKDNFSPVLNLPEVPYESTPTGQMKQKRLFARRRTLYRSNDLSQLLPVGQIESMGIAGESYQLTLTPGLITGVYQRTKSDGSKENLLPNPAQILKGQGGDQAGYVDLDSDGNWWTPSGRLYFVKQSNSTAQQELTQARLHFFRERRFSDPYGQNTLLDYDTYDFLPIQSTDAVGNTLLAHNDYRVVQADVVTDENGNRSQCAFDEFGQVVGMAVMGKSTENIGDSLNQFQASLSSDVIKQFFANPRGPLAATLLGNATTRTIEDMSRYWLEPDVTKKLPTYFATLSRERHVTDSSTGPLKIQVAFTYYDGFGRAIQNKAQADPGPVVDAGPIVSQRWIGSGWTIFNNKGNPVKQFEPFFDTSHEFIFDNQVGVSSTLFYDPLDRVVGNLHPNHAWTKLIFDPWQQTSFDQNDTVLLDAKTDPDMGQFFQLLPVTEYQPTWYQARIAGQKGPEEQSAAVKAAVHANTPTVVQLDSLNHPFLTTVDNGSAGKYSTRSTLDISGNTLDVTDSLGRIAERSTYDMLNNRIYKASMESGERWTVYDDSRNRIYIWDSKDQRFRSVYDAARRGIETNLQQGQQGEIMVWKRVYGDSLQDGALHNQRARVFQTFDQAGVETHLDYDFKGNLLSSQRQFAQEYKANLDWATVVPLDIAVYLLRNQYDALNRVVGQTMPDNTVTNRSYNDANQLEQVQSNINGAQTNGQPTWMTFISNINYNAKGQRTLIQYGNNVSTNYVYDAYTFRLIQLQTLRTGSSLQNLNYFYDPVGNITKIRDDAQQTTFFRNQIIAPSNDYTYDAIYRLIQASGREHLGQLNGQVGNPTPPAPIDLFHTSLDQPGDGNAMGLYTESYIFDAVGNLLSVQHAGGDAAHPGWTRTYAYNETSQIEGSNVNNRLSSTAVGGVTSSYGYDAHGNITYPHLSRMEWDFKDQLHVSAMQHVNAGTPVTTWYVYDSNGNRVRKITERYSPAGQIPTPLKERIYLESFELYRQYNADGTTVTLERNSLHIMDNNKRAALVEIRTIGDEPGIPQQLYRYQFGNLLDSVALELDDQAQIVSYEEYTPFGSTSYQAVRSKTETPKRYRYAGKERDEESGLDYFGARYYASWLGRWGSCDPGGLVDGVNLYAYVQSNPIRNHDPNGMQTKLAPDDPDPIVADCVAPGECYYNKRQSEIDDLKELRQEERIVDAAGAQQNPVSQAVFWIGKQFTNDVDKLIKVSNDIGEMAFGLAVSMAGVVEGKNQVKSVGNAPEPPTPESRSVEDREDLPKVQSTPATPETEPAPPPPPEPPTGVPPSFGGGGGGGGASESDLRLRFTKEATNVVRQENQRLLDAIAGGDAQLRALPIPLSDPEIRILTKTDITQKPYRQVFGNAMHRLVPLAFAKNEFLNRFVENAQDLGVKNRPDWFLRPYVIPLFPSVELASIFSRKEHEEQGRTDKSLILTFHPYKVDY